MVSGIVHGMLEAEYHAHPALSSTGARLLLESPAKFEYGQTHPRADKDEFDLGSAVHSKVLGTGYEVVVIPTELLGANGAASTVAAKAFIADARAAGQIPMKQAVVDERDAIAESVLAHPTARAFLEQKGDAEASVFATDPETGIEVRARFDLLAATCVDLKSARDASKTGFEKAATDHGYFIQDIWYRDTLLFATGEKRQMVFVVVETEPPYLVATHQLDVVFNDAGTRAARMARQLFAACTESGVWPGYPNEVQLLSPPTWAVYKFEEQYA